MCVLKPLDRYLCAMLCYGQIEIGAARPGGENGEMRAEFLAGCKSAQEARKLAPWASKVARVEGGYMAWESLSDYETWRKQK